MKTIYDTTLFQQPVCWLRNMEHQSSIFKSTIHREISRRSNKPHTNPLQEEFCTVIWVRTAQSCRNSDANAWRAPESLHWHATDAPMCLCSAVSQRELIALRTKHSYHLKAGGIFCEWDIPSTKKVPKSWNVQGLVGEHDSGTFRLRYRALDRPFTTVQPAGPQTR